MPSLDASTETALDAGLTTSLTGLGNNITVGGVLQMLDNANLPRLAIRPCSCALRRARARKAATSQPRRRGGGGTGKMLFFFSFTGSRGSFHGDLNFYGKNGAAFYTQYKTVTSNWRFSASDGMSLAWDMPSKVAVPRPTSSRITSESAVA